MAFLKLGELIEINPANMQSVESVAPMIDAQIIANFAKVATNLKRIAPKAEDFLYFSAVMMHAAEASLLNEDGTAKMTSKGETAVASWDRRDNSWRWKSNDPSIKPYKNSNGDIFPEEELVKAHKKWIGKPLCIDHKSSSVDHVRGFIVDTYYDRNLKRVIALCALDKFNYPDLARKVATGYSNSVSMGTAVGRAICSDCGTVAKTEADFCKCMRGRTCYGEINVDLNPIELSIVVNGADPQAKIKHIIASQVDALNSYVDNKAAELKKLADAEYSVNLSYSDPSKPGDSGSVSLKATTIDQLKQDIDKALADFEKINSSVNSQNLSENTNDTALPQTHSTVAMEESDLEPTDRNIAPPTERYASNDDGVGNQLKVIRTKLASMQQDLDKLAIQFTSTSNTKQEEIMSGNNKNLKKDAWFQGGGGVNEPTPGEVKYEKDPLQDHLRDKEDKQMVGQPPFPDVGNVEEMYPGNKSENDKELKTKLLRADLEERALQRQAIVEKAQERLEQVKKGYYNGTVEPKPGKQQYPVDPLQDKLRDKEDKQMVGKKPFPDVGNVEDTYPGNLTESGPEKALREKLLRAGLKARFVKATKEDGSHDLAKSSWEVFNGDKLLLTASVDEITGGLSDRLYSAIATKEYGADLISKVRKLGATEVAKGFSKKAQDAGAPPAPPPPSDGPGAPTSSPGDSAPPAMDTGKEGDPKANALDLAEKVRDLSSDLVEAVRALTGEQAEMGDVGSPGAADDGSKVSGAALHEMRKQLNGSLIVAIKEAVATLNDHEAELKTIASMYDKGAVNDVNKDVVGNLVAESLVEAKEAIAESFKLLGAFVKYARGTQAIVKRAQEEELNNANGDNMAPGQDSLMAMVEKGASAQPAADALDAMLAEDMAAADAADDNDASDEDDDNDASDADDNDAGNVMTNDPAKAKEMADKGMDVKVTAEDNLAARTEMRAKLAAEMKWHPMLADFHKFLEDPDFDTKPSNNGGHFETVEEIHEAVLDVATAPPKVRKEAEAINELIVQGRLDPADLDALVANGVDPEAVKYWKAFYGQAGSEGSQFATELVKEHAKAQLEAEMAHYRVKIARAYELAHEMRERELIPGDRASVSNQVDEIMKWNDESFESVKRVIASQKPTLRKAAGHMPQVGVIGMSDNSAGNGEDNDFASQLNAAFSKSSKRLF